MQTQTLQALARIPSSCLLKTGDNERKHEKFVPPAGRPWRSCSAPSGTLWAALAGGGGGSLLTFLNSEIFIVIIAKKCHLAYSP